MNILRSHLAVLAIGLFAFTPIQSALAGNTNCEVVIGSDNADFTAKVNSKLQKGDRVVVGTSLTSDSDGFIFYALVCDA